MRTPRCCACGRFVAKEYRTPLLARAGLWACLREACYKSALKRAGWEP